MHAAECFKQCCDQSILKCGLAKFEECFESLEAKLGHSKIEVFQHVKQSYTKPNGAQVI